MIEDSSRQTDEVQVDIKAVKAEPRDLPELIRQTLGSFQEVSRGLHRVQNEISTLLQQAGSAQALPRPWMPWQKIPIPGPRPQPGAGASPATGAGSSAGPAAGPAGHAAGPAAGPIGPAGTAMGAPPTAPSGAPQGAPFGPVPHAPPTAAMTPWGHALAPPWGTTPAWGPYPMPQIPVPFPAHAPLVPQAAPTPLRAVSAGAVLHSAAGPAWPQTEATPRPPRLTRELRTMPPQARVPGIDLVDEGGEYALEIEVPGVKKEDLEILCFDQTLVVNATSQSGLAEGTLLLGERGCVEYRRTVPLPTAVHTEGCHATLKDGVLTVRLVKRVPTEGPRRLDVMYG